LPARFPGDGKPKPVAFPDPSVVYTIRDGIRYVPLEVLIELKLASGMSNVNRLRDLADVQDFVKKAGLPRDIVDGLDPSVRKKYVELWDGAQADLREHEMAEMPGGDNPCS
jgi:hypothetical protein